VFNNNTRRRPQEEGGPVAWSAAAWFGLPELGRA
jgi:hypothetical protein